MLEESGGDGILRRPCMIWLLKLVFCGKFEVLVNKASCLFSVWVPTFWFISLCQL